jgi:hypothetical protein
MGDLDSYSLDRALAALGEQLGFMGFSAHLVVIGGGGLLMLGIPRGVTRDVDVVALEHNGALLPAEPLPEEIAQAAKLVARDFGLPENWLNHGPAGLLKQGLPDGFAERLQSREYGPALRVSFASRIDQIFFKLYAWADRRESRDFNDLQQLEPTETELHQAAAWARTHNMPGPFDKALAQALADFGVDDLGRDA